MKKHVLVKIIPYLLIAVFVFFAKDIFAKDPPENSFTYGTDALEVEFIDVGQGDSVLIKTPGDKIILVDCGEVDAVSAVMEALDRNQVQTIDLLVASHPHSDHIGSMEHILDEYAVEKLLLPDIHHDSETYEQLLQTVSQNDIPIEYAQAGCSILVDPNVNVVAAGPIYTDYLNTNDSSIVLNVTYKGTSLLLTGDIEQDALADLIAVHPHLLDCDILKISHHGGITGISQEFLDICSPVHAVISVGNDNAYGHPHLETLELLSEQNIPVYRTDRLGNIRASSDGESFTFDRSGEFFRFNDQMTVYSSKSGSTYHKEHCASLKKSETIFSTTMKAAKEQGLSACKNCFA